MKDMKFYWEQAEKEIRIEVPGFSKNEIDATVTSDALIVKAVKNMHEVEHGKNFYKEENYSQSFTKSLAFPKKINPNAFDVKITDELVLIKKKNRKD